MTNRPERLDTGAHLDAGGRLLEVRAARRLPGGGGDRLARWIVAFAGVTDRAGAEALRGAMLRAAPLHEEGVLWVHELIGAEVADTTGRRLGRIAAVEANPASDLLVLEDGGLIPLRFVTGQAPGSVTVEVPPGLLPAD